MLFEGHKVEVLNYNGSPLFNPYDVGKCLEIKGSAIRMAISKMNPKQVIKLKNSDVNSLDIRKLNNAGESFLTESGVYKLVFQSRKPDAEAFIDWIADIVLPTIRKTGGYISNDDVFISTYLPFTDDQTKMLFKSTLQTVRQLNDKIEADRPKVLFADAVTASKTDILIGELAKIIRQNGCDIGEKRLFKWLREHGYLISRKGTDYNAPTQRSVDMGLFRVKETAITHADGHTTISKTTKVTGKGQSYFINKFLAQ